MKICEAITFDLSRHQGLSRQDWDGLGDFVVSRSPHVRGWRLGPRYGLVIVAVRITVILLFDIYIYGVKIGVPPNHSCLWDFALLMGNVQFDD